MSVSPGERLGPYELVSRIGAGGMGEVWRARDTRLERSVAVKILPAEFAEDPQLRVRFAREARAISQLNHPHICTLYDVGENYLVMELLDGESLADRIDRGALPLADVLRYGAQIAEALDRAHKAGIVHRDLKPGNVVITKSGAKLLDFGLAKSAGVTARADGATEQKRLTEEGTIVGTFQYMAPEQLEGREVDARTDIFALGDVLYEMTTGKPAFEGRSRMSLVAAILSGEPEPVSQLQPLTPPALEHVIAKCLSKDPDERWQSAHDVAEQLRWIARQSAAPAARPRTRERLLWIAGMIALAAAASWLALRPRATEEVIESTILTDGNESLGFFGGPPALSPDGRFLVYAARDAAGPGRLRLRSMDRETTRVIEGTDGALLPFWSPDSRFIAFSTADGRLRRVAVGGGDVQTIGPYRSLGGGWNRDGIILFVPNLGGPIYRVAASGGSPAEVLSPAAIGAAQLGWPAFLPDGNHFLFVTLGGPVMKRGQAGVWVATLDGSEPPRYIAPASSHVVYLDSGYLVFALDGVLRARKFDLKRLRVSGEAMTIAPVQVSYNSFFTASNGLLVYQRPGSAPRSELLVKNRQGEVVARVSDAAYYWAPELSPDGLRVAVDRSDDSGRGDIWVLGLAGGATRVSFEANNETDPVWSPRGDELVYSIEGSAEGFIMLRTRIGGTPQKLLPSRGDLITPADWSPQGLHVAFDRTTSGNFDLAVWSLAEQKWIDVAAGAANEGRAAFSPDGKWIAYQSDESGRLEIYVQPFPPTGAKYQVSPQGGMTPRWSRTGEIAWAGLDNRVQAARVETAPAFRAGIAERLFPIEQRNPWTQEFDVAPNGDFLVNTPLPAPPRPMTLVVNWQRRLEAAK